MLLTEVYYLVYSLTVTVLTYLHHLVIQQSSFSSSIISNKSLVLFSVHSIIMY